ncbi:MAG TPA: hypothetical protein VMA09_20615 [Candidatus Binataceae bacterium]|nr:hypothetical protein [Candidatus Binataceae bacterium]
MKQIIAGCSQLDERLQHIDGFQCEADSASRALRLGCGFEAEVSGAFDLNRSSAQADISYPQPHCFGRSHPSEEQGMREGIISVVRPGVVEPANFPVPAFEVLEDSIAFLGLKWRRTGDDLFGPSQLGKRERGRNFFLQCLPHHGSK